jgi:hypothetical protein
MEEEQHTVRFRSFAIRRKLISAGIGVLVLAGGFYWYQIRPMEVRSTCAIESSQRAFVDESAKGDPGLERLRTQNEAFETYYHLCVRSRGLSD